MKHVFLCFWLFGFLTSWHLTSSLLAQEATVSGYVLRRGVVPMAGAHVEYIPFDEGPGYQTQCDSNGFYTIPGIALGVPEEQRQQDAQTALVTNSVGSSRSFYFPSAEPERKARIFDILGREVATIDLQPVPIDGLWINAGSWDGGNAANGVYFAAVNGSTNRAVKFVHLRDGSPGLPPQITASVLQSLHAASSRHHRTLDDGFGVSITPDTAGPRFAVRYYNRFVHEGDNGVMMDTVWSARPHRILFVGNSYTYVNGGVDVHLWNLIHAADSTYPIVTQRIAQGGYTLGDHWNYAPTRAAIDTGRWEVVVLQEQSQRPAIEPDSFYYFARLLNGEILHSRAETAFYMTWAREYDPPMIEPLAAAYDSMGCELGAVVSPCGRAFERAIAQDSTIQLYDTDGSHPSVWGTYLACCVFYASLMQQSPVGITYVNDPQITPDERLFLQTIAWETVQQEE